MLRRALVLAVCAALAGCVSVDDRFAAALGKDSDKMTATELNARFGAPGRIVFRDGGHAGYPEVVLANKYGSATIALLGGNVLSYRPTGHADVLFRPAKTDYNRRDKFHGGIPVCWPQFGNRFSSALPGHGFAALMVFDVRATQYTEELTEVTLGLKSTDETKKLWPHDFDLELVISVTMKLNLKLKTTNTGDAPLAFSCGFHPYFRVRERNAVTVKGLAGLDFVDGTVESLPTCHQEGELKADHSTDSIYTNKPAPKHEYALLDARLKRALALVSSGNDCTVVWNPGPETIDELPDLQADDWPKFLCVEPVSDWPGGRTLAPGQSYELLAAIQAHLEECAQ